MKLRSKLLLSATCLLTISVAATATSAYAWFVSNRQASVTINNTFVKTNATNLKIAGVTKNATNGDTAELSTDQDNPNGVTANSDIKATDISGDGVDFYKPRLAPDFGVKKGDTATATYNATSISKVINSSTETYYHQFKLEFSQDNANVNTGVFLSSDSKVLLSTDTTTATGLSLCTRVAFLNEAGALLRYWAPNRTSQNANQSYICTDEFDGDTVSIEDNTSSSVLQSVSADTNNIIHGKTIYGKPEEVNDDTTNKDTKNTFLLKLTGTTAQKITVRIWFEGMDKACDKAYLSQKINANLKFNGVNMDI